MKGHLQWAALAAGVMIGVTGYAQVPANAPAGTAGLCKDGSYYSGQTRQGACVEHGGVKDWYGAGEPDQAPAAAAHTAAGTAAPSTAPTQPGDTTRRPRKKLSGFGQVLVDPTSKTYYCGDSEAHAKTKDGEYMTENDAKAAGNHPDHGKACS